MRTRHSNRGAGNGGVATLFTVTAIVTPASRSSEWISRAQLQPPHRSSARLGRQPPGLALGERGGRWHGPDRGEHHPGAHPDPHDGGSLHLLDAGSTPTTL